MEGEELKRNRERFRKWLCTHAVSRTVRGFLPAFLEEDSRKYHLTVDDSMQPCTNGDTIVISLPPCVLNDELDYGDWLVLLRAVTAHEAEHINSSCFRDIHTIRRWFGTRFRKNHGIPYETGAGIAQNVLNIVEDGRIEAISVARRPGMEVPFRMLNYYIRKETAITRVATNPKAEAEDFFGLLLSYAKTGKPSPGAECYQNTALWEAYENSISWIDRAVSMDTSEGCRKNTMDLLKAVEPYLVKLLKESEELTELFGQKQMQEYTQNRAEANQMGRIRRFEGNNPLRQAGGVLHPGGGTETSDSIRGSGVTSIEGKNREALDNLKKTLARKLTEETRSQKEKIPVYEGLGEKEVKEICSFFTNPAEELTVRILPIPGEDPLPKELLQSALFLRRRVKNILGSRRESRSNLRRGRLDPGLLWKRPFSDQLFMRKGDFQKGSCAFYILIDNSGSMSAYTEGHRLQKYEAARSAAAIVEEALRGLVACKIALFYDTDRVYHDILRNFTDKSPRNYTWNSLTEAGPGGSNADAVHIRIAGKELAKRPEEKKVLLVLSDGIPSAYSSAESATAEVNKAVKDVRRSGVSVMALMFGDEAFIQANKSRYTQLYEKDIYACTPQEINQKLSDLFQKIIAR